jgi:hypothetical protein
MSSLLRKKRDKSNGNNWLLKGHNTALLFLIRL